MTEHNGTRYIFISRIMKATDNLEHIDYMQKLVKEYKKYYENLKVTWNIFYIEQWLFYKTRAGMYFLIYCYSSIEIKTGSVEWIYI